MKPRTAIAVLGLALALLSPTSASADAESVERNGTISGTVAPTAATGRFASDVSG